MMQNPPIFGVKFGHCQDFHDDHFKKDADSNSVMIKELKQSLLEPSIPIAMKLRPEDIEHWDECSESSRKISGQDKLFHVATPSTSRRLIEWLKDQIEFQVLYIMNNVVSDAIKVIKILEVLHVAVSKAMPSPLISAVYCPQIFLVVTKIKQNCPGVLYMAYQGLALFHKPLTLIVERIKAGSASPGLGSVIIYLECLLTEFLATLLEILKGAAPPPDCKDFEELALSQSLIRLEGTRLDTSIEKTTRCLMAGTLSSANQDIREVIARKTTTDEDKGKGRCA